MMNNFTFEVLNANTQKAQSVLRRYDFYSNKDDIYKAYGRPSSKKVEAFNKIKKEMEDNGGFGMRITGAGCDVFSCAYKMNYEGKDVLIWHTPAHRYMIEL